MCICFYSCYDAKDVISLLIQLTEYAFGTKVLILQASILDFAIMRCESGWGNILFAFFLNVLYAASWDRLSKLMLLDVFFQWRWAWKTTGNSCRTFWAWEKFGFFEDVSYCHTCSFCDWFDLWFLVDKHDASLLKTESNATKLNDPNAILILHSCLTSLVTWN